MGLHCRLEKTERLLQGCLLQHACRNDNRCAMRLAPADEGTGLLRGYDKCLGNDLPTKSCTFIQIGLSPYDWGRIVMDVQVLLQKQMAVLLTR